MKLLILNSLLILNTKQKRVPGAQTLKTQIGPIPSLCLQQSSLVSHGTVNSIMGQAAICV